MIRGVSFFFNKLKFTLGGKSEPTESELRTIALTTPVSEAKSLEAVMPAMNCKYEWLGFEETVEVSEGSVTVNGCIIVRPSGWNAYRFRRVLSFVIYLYYLNFANMTKAILR